MKKYIIAVLAPAISLLLFNFAFAHEHDVFKIGDKQYHITVGSLNEPVVVDDKTGVDLTVTEGSGMATMSADGDMDGPAVKSTPVLGLDKDLKVEISAGGQKKIFDLKPAYGKDGSYTATFFPTVQTTYNYRVFGTLNSVPVDLTFTCNPAPSSVQGEDKNPIQLSDKVTRISKAGAFGCPLAKANLGFPIQGASNADLSSQIEALSSASAANKNSLAITALVLSILGSAAAIYALKKK